MQGNEKLDKVCSDFNKLGEEQQDYILGILQALVFAKSANNHEEGLNTADAPQNPDRN